MGLLRIFLISFLMGSNLFAQPLQLFEETENMQREIENPIAAETRRDSDGNLITGPEFTLVGTSRIGSNRVVVVEDSLGEIISLSLTEESTEIVPGYPNYRVLEISSGQVSIEYPANAACIEFLEQGVACESQRVAILSLKNASPLEPVNRGGKGNDSGLVEVSEDGDISVNPFEAILSRAANPDTEIEPDNSFTPRRISPEEVPPGMRIVSTPFGDRLVEIDQ
tara:strand:+ start:12089 stop:12760 length:672 start_codon:yes stop_codon:yes gene_type:complete